MVKSDTVLNYKYNSLFCVRIGPLLSFLAAGVSEGLSTSPAGTCTTTTAEGDAVDSSTLGRTLAWRRKELNTLLIDYITKTSFIDIHLLYLIYFPYEKIAHYIKFNYLVRCLFEHEWQTDRASYARRRCATSSLPELLPTLSYSASRAAAAAALAAASVVQRTPYWTVLSTTHYVPAPNPRVFCFELNSLPMGVGLYHHTLYFY